MFNTKQQRTDEFLVRRTHDILSYCRIHLFRYLVHLHLFVMLLVVQTQRAISTLNRRRKSVEKSKNIATVAERLYFNGSLFGVEKTLKRR